MCPDFKWYLSKQGLRGLTGEKGEQGYSPTIEESVNTPEEYKLRITNEFNTFETPNLRGDIQFIDNDGTYLRYDRELNQVTIDAADRASKEVYGVSRLANEEDLTNLELQDTVVMTPKSTRDALPQYLVSPDDSVTITHNSETEQTELRIDTSGITSRLNALDERLTEEGQIRFSADSTLQQQINAERQERETQDESLQTQLNSKLTVDNIKAGNNITITKDGNNVTINSEGGGGPVPENIMTTDTQQTVTGDKIFNGNTLKIGNESGYKTLATFDNSVHYSDPEHQYSFSEANKLEGTTIGDIRVRVPIIKEGLPPDIIYVSPLTQYGLDRVVDNQTIKVQDGLLHADLSEIGDELNSLSGRVNNLEGEVVVATSNRLGLVKPDNSTIIINEEGELTSTVGGTVKFPNATIIGTPTINNGQISDFSTTNYLQFPFEFETQGRTWLLNGSFHTGSNVTTQQNVIDSLAAVALAVRNGRLVMALSTTGTTFDLGEVESMSDIEPNTSYYFRISFSGTQYMLSLSTDKIDYMPEAIVSSSTPIAARPMTISSSGHPYGDIINMNDWDLTVGNVMVWQGMADVGSASRMDVSASNADNSAYEVMKNTTALTSGNITDNTRLYNEVLDRSHSTFDLSKFTTAGSPTITDDGITSGFSNSNYIDTGYVFSPNGKPWKIKATFTTGSVSESQGIQGCIGSGDYVSCFYIEQGKFCSFLSSNGYSWDLIVGSGASFLTSQPNTTYEAICEYTGTEYIWTYNGNVVYILQKSTPVKDGGRIHLGNNRGQNNPFFGSIDLKQFSIEIDGKEVFNGNKTGVDTIGDIEIPYTLSKTGSKIVEAQYRDRVEDVYNQTGKALYYTLDEDNKQAAAPICDIYGVLTRLNDSLGDISSLLDIINGEEVSALSTLAAMPMMLSLEPTELDLEDSFNSSIERATYDCDLDITPLDYESYDDDDTDIDLGGNK